MASVMLSDSPPQIFGAGERVLIFLTVGCLPWPAGMMRTSLSITEPKTETELKAGEWKLCVFLNQFAYKWDSP